MKLQDPYFKVVVLSKTDRPNLLSYIAMHQCVAEKKVKPEKIAELSEQELGRRLVEHCLKYGHHSVVEHPCISLLVQGYPHDVMVQITRHRHFSFSVQSQRYTGDRIVDLANFLKKSKSKQANCKAIYEQFYVRPVGIYRDKNGTYTQTQLTLNSELFSYKPMILDYSINAKRNMPYEMARYSLPQCIRQDFVVTMNPRSLMHFLDLRALSDAQLEIRQLANEVFLIFQEWMPEVAEWYEQNRKGKNKLAP